MSPTTTWLNANGSIHLYWVIGLVSILLTLVGSWSRRSRYRADLTPDARSVDPIPPFATETIAVGRWAWRLHRSGRGPSVLMLHGLGANLYTWRSLAREFGGRSDLIIPDLPGFGGSSKHQDATYGLDVQVDRLVALLDHLGVSDVSVVGNSMGGNLALWLALRHPDRVRAVAAIAPAVSPSLVPAGLTYLYWAAHPLSYLATTRTLTWIYGRTVSKATVIDAERIRESFTTYGRQHQAIRTLMSATSAIRDARLPSGLSELRPPAMILWGSRDRLVSRAVIDALTKLLPGAESYVHLGGGHHLQEDEPEWTAEKLTSFFAQLQD